MNEIANQKSTKNNRVFGIFRRLNKIHKFNKLANSDNSNKRRLRADDYLSLSSALRPRLLGSVINNSFKVSSLKHRLMFPLGLVSSIILSSIIFQNLCNVNVSAASLTLSVPNSISLNINPATSSGDGSSVGSNGSVYAKSSNSNITIKTDAAFGYTLDIKSSSSNNNANDLINGSSKLSSITNLDGLSEEAYKTSGTVNTWGYIPSKLGGKDNTNIMPGPTSTNTTIEKTTQANTNNNNTYTIALVSKIDNTLASGTYKNSFVISAIVNSVSYSITYDLTNGTWDNAQNPNPQVGNTTEGTIKLYSTTPTRSGYTFQGWCDQKPIVNDTAGGTDTCMGVTYEAGKDYPLNSTNNNITVYAIWQKDSGGGCFIAGTLVDTPEGPRPIESISYGDKVYSYDFEHERIVEDTVDGYYDVERSDVVKMTFENGTSIEGTYPHRFYSAARDEWIQMGEFKSGDTLHTVNGLDTTIQSIERLLDKIKVYNLQTAEYHNFFIVVNDNSDNNDNYNRYIVKAVIPGNWDADDDYLLKRYPVLPIAPGSHTTFPIDPA